MQRDAQIGLIIGVILLVAVAVLFFRPDPPAPLDHDDRPVAEAGSTITPADPSRRHASNSAPSGSGSPINPMGRHRRSGPVLPAGATRPVLPTVGSTRKYTIKEGDTLMGIARQVYGRGSLFPLIYRANEGILLDPNHLPVGKAITIPEPSPTDP